MNFLEIWIGVVLLVTWKLVAVNGENTFSVTTVYEDNTCTATGNSLFAVSSCITDYEGFVATAFGETNPYMIHRYYSATGCNNVGYVYAYSADGYCHMYPDSSSGFGSFRAPIDVNGAIGFVWFLDSACTNWKVSSGPIKELMNPVYCSYWECDLMLPLCSYESCGSPPYGFCGSGMSVGGPISVALTSEMVCIPQTDHYDPVCSSDGESYTASDCTKYYSGGWDDLGIISNAFGSLPYLVVEKLVWCGLVDTVTDVMVYRLDESCYPNAAGNASHKLTLGRSLTITTYTDANCMSGASEVTVNLSTIQSKRCTADDKKVFLANTKTSFSVVAVYEDSACSGTPSQLTFTPTIWRDPLGAANAPCQSLGGSLFSVSSCTQDYPAFATTAFGADNVFVIEEAFSKGYCDNVGFMTAYAADGNCHTDLDGTTSFKAELGTDITLTLRTFFDSVCSDGRNTAALTTDQLASPMCRKLSLGGLDGPPALGRRTIVTLYGDSSCSSPATTMTLTTELTCTPQIDHYNPLCVQNEAAYSVSDCTQYYVGGWDDIGIIRDAFGDYPYLMVEKYMTGRCGDGDAILNVKIFKLDENCYPDTTGSGSHRLMLGYSVTITTYSDVNCLNVSTITTVDQSMFTTSAAGNCIDNDKKYYVVNAQTSFASLAIYEDSSCSGSPSLITFSPMLECQELTNYANTTCHSTGNSLFAMTSCTTDFVAFATTAFGNAPFMVDRYYPVSDCNSVGYVNVFSADAFCHTNPVETSSFSSFRARIAADGSLSFSFFHDAACKDNYHGGGLGNDMLTSSYCMPEVCEIMNAMCSRQNCGSPPYGHCGRMISVGGPSGTPPTGKLSSITVFADNSCSSPAVSVTLTSDTTCTSQSDHYELPCTTDGKAYYTSECTQYYTGGSDDRGIISHAFGNSPYLVVEKYVWCGMVDTVTDVKTQTA
ncbi:hypothetical protein PR002_g15590 [Phytophthora rubi]|uniref:Membrane-associated protein n=1 Tax=Phytophthora rubi TaxID=129364 RepID=A0A6A3L195_9STRA|nr:hypothetical protein PR002_g15590 [Phytophthora rubi]